MVVEGIHPGPASTPTWIPNFNNISLFSMSPSTNPSLTHDDIDLLHIRTTSFGDNLRQLNPKITFPRTVLPEQAWMEVQISTDMANWALPFKITMLTKTSGSSLCHSLHSLLLQLLPFIRQRCEPRQETTHSILLLHSAMLLSISHHRRTQIE